MEIPESASEFIDSVITDSRMLIDLGLWDIKMARLDSWLNQFCGEEQEFFSACLLDQIVFRNTQQFEAGLRSLFRSNLNGELFQGEPDLELSDRLRKQSEPKLRLVPVICEDDPPTKSGPLVLRRLQRIQKIRNKWMVWPWMADSHVNENDVNVILFIDDFLGTGEQFEKFFKQWKYENISTDVNFYYVPVVAHQQGIDYLLEKLPSVKVIPAETVQPYNGFFSDEVWERLGQGVISAENAKKWYIDFVNSKNIVPKTGGVLGYGDLGLSIAFSHSTPNNSLPIYWFETTGWQPLLER